MRAFSDIFPDSWAAPALPPYRYDPADARRLLARAGWTPGSDGILRKGALAMHLSIYATTGHQENTESQVLIQSMLRAVGIDVAIRNYPGSYLFAMDGPLYGGKYDLEWSIETNGPDPDNAGDWNEPSFRHAAQTRRGSTIPSSTRPAPPRRVRSTSRNASGSTSAKRRLRARRSGGLLQLARELHRDESRPAQLRSGRLHRRQLERLAVEHLIDESSPRFSTRASAHGSRSRPTRGGVLSLEHPY